MKYKDLNDLKARKKISSRALARDLGISESYLSEILSGKRRPSRDFALAISEKTGISVISLLFPL